MAARTKGAELAPLGQSQAAAPQNDQAHADQVQHADPVAAGLVNLADETEATLHPPGDGVTDLDVAEREPAPPLFDPQLAQDNVGVLMAGMGAVREGMFHLAQLKSPRVTLADENIAAAADAIGKVLAKHKVNLREYSRGYELELSAAFIVWPIGLAVYAGIKGELDERAAAGKSKPAAIAAAPAVAAGALGEGADAAPTFPPGDPRNVSLNAGG